MWEIPLQFDRSFGRQLTWIPTALGDGIRARVPFNGSELVLDVALRWRRTAAEAPGTIYVSPRSTDVWATEPAKIHPEMLRCQLVLYGVPATIDFAFRSNL